MKVIIKRKIKQNIIDRLLNRNRCKIISEKDYPGNNVKAKGNILKLIDINLSKEC